MTIVHIRMHLDHLNTDPANLDALQCLLTNVLESSYPAMEPWVERIEIPEEEFALSWEKEE